MPETTPEQIERAFEERAVKPSGLAAERDLAAGHWIAFREKDTPAGHVLRRYPSGLIEMVKVDLACRASTRAR